MKVGDLVIHRPTNTVGVVTWRGDFYAVEVSWADGHTEMIDPKFIEVIA